MDDLPLDIDQLDLEGLRALVVKLLTELQALKAENNALRQELRRLKGLNDPPDIKPSGMDSKARSRGKAKAGRKANKARRGAKKGRVRIDETQVIETPAPPGSRFCGYEDYLLQDLRCHPHTILLRRQRWRTPDNDWIVAPLPVGVRGHFGAELRRFVLALYHGAQTTVERLTALLRDLGVDISKRQVVRLLNEPDGPGASPGFADEAQEVLRAGLGSAPWISVDDTSDFRKVDAGFRTKIATKIMPVRCVTVSRAQSAARARTSSAVNSTSPQPSHSFCCRIFEPQNRRPLLLKMLRRPGFPITVIVARDLELEPL